MRNKDVYKSLISLFGADAQSIIAIEELSELQKEICKQFRGSGLNENLIEEIADVSIMLDQLQIMYNCVKKVERIKEEKIQRTINRYLPNYKKEYKPILSERKIDILKLACLSNKKISDRLYIEPETINTHLSQIYKLLGVKNRASAIIEALKKDEIKLEDVVTE